MEAVKVGSALMSMRESCLFRTGLRSLCIDESVVWRYHRIQAALIYGAHKGSVAFVVVLDSLSATVEDQARGGVMVRGNEPRQL